MRSVQQLFDLTGKTAVVTGGTRGLGQAMAIGLAEAGADIILVQRSEKSTETKNIIEKLGRKVHTYIADMNDRTALTNLIPEITSTHKPTILLNSAGIIKRSPAVSHSLEQYDETFSSNVTSSWILCQAIGKYWIDNSIRGGKIINVSSVLGQIAAPGSAAYNMSKGAIEQLTKSLAVEWADKGINVNIIAPGFCDTDMNAEIRAPGDEEFNKSANGMIPQARWGNAEDFKGPAVFLASEASAYINGESMIIDGGLMAQ